jgi:hypothetical protein
LASNLKVFSADHHGYTLLQYFSMTSCWLDQLQRIV